MKPRLSIFSALRETFYLWTRNFWIVTVIAVATGLPELALIHLQLTFAPMPRSPLHMSPEFIQITTAFTLISLVADFILGAVSTAAILGVLIRPATEPNPWPALRRSIATKTWTLCRLYILLTLIAVIPWLLIFNLLLSLRVMATSPVGLLLFGIYIIMIKYALADPLVVKEGMGARAALKRSWQMTRGAFWYVLGCYLCLVGVQQLLHWIFSSVHFAAGPAGLFRLLGSLAGEVVSPLWIIVSWVMYNQIKAVERIDAPPPAQTPAP